MGQLMSTEYIEKGYRRPPKGRTAKAIIQKYRSCQEKYWQIRIVGKWV